MTFKYLTADLAVSGQIAPQDVAEIAAAGFKTILSNRPDHEGGGQPLFADIETEAKKHGLTTYHLPVISGLMSENDARSFGALMAELPKPIFAYCRSGTRCATLWGWSEAGHRPADDIIEKGSDAGYDLRAVASRIIPPASDGGSGQQQQGIPAASETASPRANSRANAGTASKHAVVIVGGGAAGAAVAASLLRRKPDLDVAIIEPSETHYYQPGWTLVGAGVFRATQTAKAMNSVLPGRANWIKGRVETFDPDNNQVTISNAEGVKTIAYGYLVVCPGLKLNWDGVEGLAETMGKNGVTSNYRYDLAPYTWQLVQNLTSGRAIFTQPPMPIKCAGAPQKAMYLSADHWLRHHRLNNIDVSFFNAGQVLFGVADYVPALMDYIKRYDVSLKFGHTLIAVDGPARTARFRKANDDGSTEIVETNFEMLHVCPPQIAPDFVRLSPLADAAGWIDVDQHSLRHKRYENVFGLGDATNTPNAKTAAAARKQAPVVAENLLYALGAGNCACVYDGYGSCPLTVERGKIVLAEFTYGGKVAPSFPSYLIDGTRPSRMAWLLKERVLPPIYWKAMLRGHEWMAKPKAASE